MIRSVALLAIIVQSASAKDTGGKKRTLRFNEVRKLGGDWDEPIEVVEAEPHWDEPEVVEAEPHWDEPEVVEAEPHWDEPEVVEAEPHWESHSSSTVQQAKASKGDSGTAKAAKAGVEETHSYSWGDSEVVEAEPHWDEPEVEEAEPHWEPV